MRRKRLHWQIYPSFLVILLASLGVLTWYTTVSIRNFYLAQEAEDLGERTHILVSLFTSRYRLPLTMEIDPLVKQLSEGTTMRLTLIDTDGTVLADSKENPRHMENHRQRPEIQDALDGHMGQSIRFSDTLHARLLYVAAPILHEQQVIAVIRAAVPLTALEYTIQTMQTRIILSGLILALLVSLVSFMVSRRIAHPIEEIRKGAERFAHGDLGFRLPVPHSEEIGSLAESMNSMATQLEDRIQALISQRNESEAVLSSMLEGVIAVNTEEELIRINNAAAQLIGVNPVEVLGRNILEVVRNVDLRNFVAHTLASEEPVRRDIHFHGNTERYVQAHGTLLRNPEGRSIGALIVLNDITHLRRLETIRRDFVANVSHELKTPITSIKGFVETLIDGAINQPEDARRFLAIIAKQSDRLSSIIEDLLSLSRIEQEAEKGQVPLSRTRLADMLASAIQLCQPRAQARHIDVHLDCPADLEGNVNARLLEQAFVNLLDNAIKYSEPNHAVRITASKSGHELMVSFQDSGCGIDREHLSRLFERFYRVDKARSREMGGTGLGLAIVKHIVQAHHGRVQVESTPGKGSTFSIRLPVDK
jgi:two-component system phosphate regulon sensor histidine kinase PhoR